MPKTTKKVRKPPVNLNTLCDNKTRGLKTVVTSSSVSVVFDSKKILRTLVSKICSASYLVGCVAWLTNSRVIAAMQKLQGVQIIVTNDKILKKVKSKYIGLKSVKNDNAPICVVGTGRGYMKSLMHHKFLVALDSQKKPLWVCNGSFNITESAKTNIENMVVYEDPNIATIFLEEYERIYKISKKLKL